MKLSTYNKTEVLSGTCRCCLTIGSFYNLWDEYTVDDKKVVFAEVLSECFGIEISRNILVNTNDQICECCIHKLYDADMFRRQITAIQNKLAQPLVFSVPKDTKLFKPNMISNVKAMVKDTNNEVTTDQEDQFSDVEYLEEDDVEYLEENSIMNEEFIEERLTEEDTAIEIGNNYSKEEVEIQSDIPNLEEYVQQFDIQQSKEDDGKDIINKPVLNIEILKSLITGDSFLKTLSELEFNVEENSNVEIIIPPVGKLNREIIMNTNNREEMVLEDLSYKPGGENELVFSRVRNMYEQNMKKCINAINSGSLSFADACRQYKCSEEVIMKRRREMRRKMIEGIKRLQKEGGEIIIKQVISPKEKVNNIKNYIDNKKIHTNKKLRLKHLKMILRNIQRGNISFQEAAEKLNLTLDELTETFTSVLPKEYKNYLCLTKIRESTKDNDFDESKMEINDDNEDDMRVVKVVRNLCRPSKDNLIKAIEAVKNGLSYLSARVIYNITPAILKKFINTDMEITDENIDLIMLKYNKCLNSAKHSINRKGVLKVEVANEILGSSKRNLINAEQRIKLEKNVHTILELTNATPFFISNHVMCAYCGLKNDNPELIREHTRTVHVDDRLTFIPNMLRPAHLKEIIRLDLHDLKCTECNIELAKIDDLYQHLENQHEYTIEQSERNFIIPFDLIYFRYKCAICDERTNNVCSLEVHMNKHFNNYICQDCGQSCVSYLQLTKHRNKVRLSTKLYECKKCGKKIKGRPKYLQHMVQHNGRSRCPYCSVLFYRRSERYSHLMKMHRDKLQDIVCKECGKVFHFKPYYMMHYRLAHLNERDYKCCYCPKKFFRQVYVKRHMKVHVGEQKFKCKICDINFCTVLELSKHWECHF